jgi:type IV pilus biogenesis protein CpaD/CtpE
MTVTLTLKAELAVLAAAAALLSGCASPQPTQSALRLSDDFGEAVNQDLAAQIADPDPAWKNSPPPASDGARAALAQTRYQQNNVIQPAMIGASGNASRSGQGGGQGGPAGPGSNAGASASAGPSGP